MEPLNICHVNAQSLRAHILEFRDFFNRVEDEVIAVSETWLTLYLMSDLV